MVWYMGALRARETKIDIIGDLSKRPKFLDIAEHDVLNKTQRRQQIHVFDPN